MNKILTIVWKEIYTTFRDRNLLLIMFATPIVLSTIMGLVFGGVGSSSNGQAFSNMPIAIVNLDEGFDFANQQFGAGNDAPSLDELEIEIGGQMINIGEQLLQNNNLGIDQNDLSADGAAFNFGTQLANILLSTPITSTESSTTTTSFNLDDLACPLIDDSEIGETGTENPFGFEGTLGDLFDATVLDNPNAARAGVDSGEYVAAIIIPASFTNSVIPLLNFDNAENDLAKGAVEVYGSGGQQISATIVRSVVEGIVNQFAGIGVALDSLLNTSANQLAAQFNLADFDLSQLDLSTLDPALVTNLLQGVDSSVLEPLGCLIMPNAGNIQLKQMPLEPIQERSNFSLVMTIFGTAQAIFVALFTGIFGINSIYDERRGGTLQRLMASPTPGWYILAGKMLGNVATVAAQLIILLLSFTLITSIVEGAPTYVWGTNIPLILAAVLIISLCVSGLGVFLVGLARSTEQVQMLGPVVSIALGALGGAFGFRLPPEISQFSLLWWGTELLRRIANGDPAIWTPILVLLGITAFFFGIGSILFKRRTAL